MKKLIVGFSYGKGAAPFSRLIRWVTKSKVSHVWTLVADQADVMVYQASGLRVNFEAWGLFEQEEAIVETYSFDLTDDQATANEHFRKEKVGSHYSWHELVGFLWVLLMRKFGKVVSNPWSDGDHAYVCVDVAAAQIPCGGKLGVEAKGNGTMTPEDLRRWCAKNGTKASVA